MLYAQLTTYTAAMTTTNWQSFLPSRPLALSLSLFLSLVSTAVSLGARYDVTTPNEVCLTFGGWLYGIKSRAATW